MADYIIKQIAVGSTPYDINAKYIQDGSGNGKTWSDITNLVETSFDIVVMAGSATLPTANASVYAQYKNNIVLCNNGQTQEDGSYIEWVITNQSGTYKWEQIGTSKTDLEEYGVAATYTTSLEGPTVTGATSGAGSVSGTVTYQKATTAQTAGAHTHGVTFSTATFAKGVTTNGTTSVWAATKAKDTFTAVKGISTTSGSFTFTQGGFDATTKYVKVASTGAAGTTIVITGYPNFAGGELTGTKTFVTSVGVGTTVTAVTGVSKNGSDTALKTLGSTPFLQSATVSNTGVLSFPTANAYNSVSASFSAMKDISTTTATVMTGVATSTGTVGFTKATLGTATTAAVAVEGIKGVTLNVAATSSTGAQKFVEAASHTASTLSGTKTFITAVEASGTDTAISTLQADGTATVIKSDGLYYANAVTGDIATVSAGGHTHNVASETATAEIDLTAAMPSHTHTISTHTHTVGVKNNKGVIPTA